MGNICAAGDFAGGLIGKPNDLNLNPNGDYHQLTMLNCYHAGTVSSKDSTAVHVAAIAGLGSWKTRHVNAIYYVDNGLKAFGENTSSAAPAPDNDHTVAMSAEELKGANIGSAYVVSDSGYPRLKTEGTAITEADVNIMPTLKNPLAREVSITLQTGADYSLDLSTIFEDWNGDAIDYTVSVDDGAFASCEAVYTLAGDGERTSAKLVFAASDGKDRGYDYTVNLSYEDVPEIIDGVFQIKTKEDLLFFAKVVNGEKVVDGVTSQDAVLLNDIALNDVSDFDTWNEENTKERIQWTPMGNSDTAAYTGTFDGNGHKITGLCINDAEGQNAGLFRYNNGTVKNLGVEYVYIHCANDAAGIAVYMTTAEALISNCYVKHARFDVSASSGWAYGGGLNSYPSGGGEINNSYCRDIEINIPDGMVGEQAGGAIGSTSIYLTMTNVYVTDVKIKNVNSAGTVAGYYDSKQAFQKSTTWPMSWGTARLKRRRRKNSSPPG